MSVKAMIFLTRRDGLTLGEFHDWWLLRHRPMAERLPGLRRHCFNLLVEGGPFDAVVEQCFDTRTAMDACYATELGKQVAADSGAHTKMRIRTVVEHHEFTVGATDAATGA